MKYEKSLEFKLTKHLKGNDTKDAVSLSYGHIACNKCKLHTFL